MIKSVREEKSCNASDSPSAWGGYNVSSMLLMWLNNDNGNEFSGFSFSVVSNVNVSEAGIDILKWENVRAKSARVHEYYARNSVCAFNYGVENRRMRDSQ